MHLLAVTFQRSKPAMLNGNESEGITSFAGNHSSCKRYSKRKRRETINMMRPSCVPSFLVIQAVVVLLSCNEFGFTKAFSARSCAGSIRHVHLAVGNDPSTEMTISFSSERSFHVPVIGGVLIGTNPDKLDTYVEEQEPARYYNATPAKERHGHYYSPYLHHITVTGLAPSATYYYKCTVRKRSEDPPTALRGNHVDKFSAESPKGEALKAQEREVFNEEDDDSLGHLSSAEDRGNDPRHRMLRLVYYDSKMGECPPPNKIRSFETAPKPGTNTPENLKFVYIGDIGQFTHSLENILHLVRHQRTTANAIMLAGDIAYSGYDNRRWDTYFDFMDDFSMIDEVPMQVCAGNHDMDKQENGTDIFLAYQNRFRMPEVKPAELGTYDGPPGLLNMDNPPYPMPYEWGNAYYAFTYGISRHIFLNAYSSMEPDSTQYQWLLKEFQSVDREHTPWLLVTIHVPIYNTFDVHHRDKQIIAARQHLEPLFVEYKVNLVIAGHVHAYQRTKTVANQTLTPTGPMHVIVGAGGRQCKASFLSPEPEPWVAVRDATRYGYGTLELYNKTHAKWEWIPTGESGACFSLFAGRHAS